MPPEDFPISMPGATRTIIVRELRRHVLLIASIAILMVVGTAVGVISPLLFKVLVDSAIPAGDLGQVAWLLAGMVLATMLAIMLRSLQEYQQTRIGEAVSQALRRRLFNHLVRVQVSALEGLRTGEIVHRITRVCGELGDVYVSNKLLPVVSNAILLAGNAVAMFLLSWQLSLVVLLASLLSYFVINMVRDYTLALERRFYAVHERGSGYLQEVFSGLRTVRALNGRERERERWDAWIGEHWSVKAKTEVFHSLVLGLPNDLVNNLAIGVVYAYGAYEIINGRLSIGTLVAFSVYVPRVYAASKAILDAHVGTAQARAAAERLDELFALEQERSGTKELPRANANGAAVEFEAVSFHYGRDNFGLVDLSFQVGAGEFLGIVRPTGGGKSTIIDLLLGFYTPLSGRIRVGGVDLRELSLESLRESIGVVPQEVFLWNDSIIQNLVYPNPVTYDKVAEAVKVAQLDELIETLPEKYETVVGERGQALSGGERQRLAICRALLREPKILLLDEATSNLDAVTELRIRDAIESVRVGRTTIVVAHRLATVMRADRILVLDRGRIVETGTPAELIANRGPFYELYEAQSL
jgi:ABC-type multidrug transport system fused ATPase/permease subunit